MTASETSGSEGERDGNSNEGDNMESTTSNPEFVASDHGLVMGYRCIVRIRKY